MSANPRRPGFRLPWVAGEGGQPAEAPDETASGGDAAEAGPPGPVNGGEAAQTATVADQLASPDASTPAEEPDAAEVPAAAETPEDAEDAEDAQPAEETTGSSTFLDELIAAMRRVAEQARESGLSELKGRADEFVSRVQSASEERATELRRRADAEVAEVGEWAKSEAERIRAEAERREAERRTQLDEQLAAETRRAEQEAKALRIRVAEYERQLDGYYARLSQIDDPAAFAAAAKRMPRPPQLSDGDADGAEGQATEPAAAEPEATEESVDEATPPPTLAPVSMAAHDDADGGTAARADARSSPGATAEPISDAPATAVVPESHEPDEEGNITTSVVVTGLASFGAITGFRQSLAGVSGVRSVQLSLGPTGEFLYRAAHATDLDLADAIGSLEGEAATVERDPNGTLRVVISRAR